MSVNERYVQAQHELINSGFRPERWGFVVKFVRRFLWPFIRPFHFYELQKIIELESRLESRLESELESRLESGLERYSALVQERCAQLRQAIAGEMEKLVREQVLFRSDMEALKNRYMSLESLDDRVAALTTKLDTLGDQLDTCGSQMEAMSHQLEVRPGRDELNALKESMAKLPPRELAITSNKFGLYIGKPGEIISDHIFRGGIWDQHILDLAREVSAQRGGKALDVGAHLGSVTIGLASLFDEVVSFEPNDFNFKILNANIVVNGLRNVRLFNSGVYSHETHLALGEQARQEIAISVDESGKFDGHSAQNLGAYTFTEQENGMFGHEARTIDSYHFENVSFIKIDVQGADGEVLMGAIDTIRRCQPVVVFEWEDLLSRNFSVSFDDLCRCLSNFGYIVSPLKVHNEKQIDYVARPKASVE